MAKTAFVTQISKRKISKKEKLNIIKKILDYNLAVIAKQ